MIPVTQTFSLVELATLAGALATDLEQRADHGHLLGVRGELRDAASRIRDARATLEQALERMARLHAPAGR